VPRNADPKIAELENCYVYDVDDLATVVDGNLSKRAEEAKKAEAIVVVEVERARKARATDRAVPIIKALRERAAAIAGAEADKTIAVLGDAVTDRQRKSVQAMANAIVGKLLHEPMTRLKSAASADADEASAEFLAIAATLFGLVDTDGEATSSAAADVLAAAVEAEAAASGVDDEQAA
jgi:glutamyl-tRNA reductase